MKVQLFTMSMLCCLGLSVSSMSIANDKVDNAYNAKQFQSVCKGKSEGDAVSFPYKGIIWNGTCQTQFFPTQSKDLKGNEEQLNSACKSDAASVSVNIEGQEYKGKCALGYAPPMPKAS
ncbi:MULTISPECIES: hypothetical protein [unclassified Acinetobacter]|uniref:hypothetical protein n=1 Tax=unclassified Acinetobacter TaxID=196816 RepID=UPI00044BEA8A|nr:MULTISPECIES: hypothetical protein [unclassified Acinetobacter]EZQ06722.1 hypothetical protein CL42_09895 [Acinetobacter sp. Ver3]SEL30487.1 hypothetical protein SAMN05216500_101349 [Acinetobacter sp. DSM 11652]